MLVVGTPSEIEQHRKFVEDSRIEYAKPANVRELFSSQALGWLRQRGSTRSRRAQLGQEHEEALVRLGYFERRSYRYINMTRQRLVWLFGEGRFTTDCAFFGSTKWRKVSWSSSRTRMISSELNVSWKKVQTAAVSASALWKSIQSLTTTDQ